ncbi:MAG: hypothetical protein ACI89X_003547 [Planctomycetota bacterium]|jgi:hypothetical protein
MKRTASSICLLALLSACGADTTAEFGPPKTVPKAKRPIVWDASTRDRLGVGDMTAPKTGAAGQQGAKRVIASVPADWEELPPARFRDAVWRIKGEPTTDIYLTIGVGGGVPFNLQRWYVQQFGKPEVPAVEALPPIDLANRPGRLVELEGTFGGKEGWAALIAFYNEGSSVTSLKFTGPKLIVQAKKKEFLAMAKSIRFGSQSSNPKAPPIRPGQALPKGHAPVGNGGSTQANGANSTTEAAAPFTATTPEGWTKKDGRRILNHTFGRGSELYISQLGGALRQSLDIWRGEISVGGTRLGPLTDGEYKALAQALFLGDDAVLMDLTGSFQGMTGNQIENARLLVAARLDGSTITFCKLVGPQDEVDAQRAAFVQFCGSVRRTQ